MTCPGCERHRTNGRGWCGNCGTALDIESLDQIREQFAARELVERRLRLSWDDAIRERDAARKQADLNAQYRDNAVLQGLVITKERDAARNALDSASRRIDELEAKLRECARIAIRISGAEVRAGLTGDATYPDDVPALIEDIMTLMVRAGVSRG